MFEKSESQVVVTSCVFNCLKDKCPKWVIVRDTKDDKEVHYGRCADALTPMILIEIKELMKKMAEVTQ